MSTPIRVPGLGTATDEIKLLEWVVSEGEKVKRGDVICEMETDKAVVQLESVAEGILLKQVVPAGTLVEEGTVIAYVGAAGEEVPEEEVAASREQSASAREEKSRAARPLSPANAAIKASTMVRNLAGKMGVDLAHVKGTGPGGLITREDLQKAAEGETRREKPASEESLPPAQSAVARAVTHSVREKVHLRVEAGVDMTRAEKVHREAGVAYDVIFVKALAKCLRELPAAGFRLAGDRILRPEGCHIALAIGFDNDVFTPVIRDADEKDLPTIQKEVDELVSGARSRRLKPDQMAGGCMAVSNLGMYPIETFDAIIHPEHSAMLAVGAIQSKPVVANGEIEIRPMATLNLSVDHRLMNGRKAAQFLTRVKSIIEFGELD